MKTNKQLVIHDLGRDWDGAGICEGGELLDSTAVENHCIGCFGCWTKTPGVCIIRDGFETTGAKYADIDELIIVSRGTYGGLSPAVKNVMDRAIAYLMPFFTIRRDKQMHHVSRYPKQIKLRYHLYGDMTPAEQETARSLVDRNALNLNITDYSVAFHTQLQKDGRQTA